MMRLNLQISLPTCMATAVACDTAMFRLNVLPRCFISTKKAAAADLKREIIVCVRPPIHALQPYSRHIDLCASCHGSSDSGAPLRHKRGLPLLPSDCNIVASAEAKCDPTKCRRTTMTCKLAADGWCKASPDLSTIPDCQICFCTETVQRKQTDEYKKLVGERDKKAADQAAFEQQRIAQMQGQVEDERLRQMIVLDSRITYPKS
ncbi:hypothetical protein C8J56DRAFT_969175 [Mycena floridula]|nr:hypothetical protein C8J56DRAFT_969175 [Mycena floridula]